MNYTEINTAILESRDVNEALVTKNDAFYEYLLNNKVAYLYASSLSKEQTDFERRLITQFEQYQARYEKSLAIINDVCREGGFEYLLYKTHKYVPDMVDGDIDIMVRPEDFNPFMEAFAAKGFAVEEDEPGKGKCEKDGYCVIEPHTNVSWRGGGYLQQEFIWANPRTVTVGSMEIATVSYEIEMVAILAKILFEPSYLDLYCLASMKYFYREGLDEARMLENATRPELLTTVLAFCKDREAQPKGRFPAFLPVSTYVTLWTKNVLQAKDYKVYVLHTAFFIYWKLRYPVTGKLPFTHHHDWKN